ncbi:MAG: aminotransferase class V-fold PLP-dependent enzyme, partial [Gemmatimonadetes bacterium]|nr:aminotransferase class V-fold PLP-dependent enzyme [Gemmatimonadota bacterium]
AWVLSPMASEIEAQAVRWMAQLVGMPDGTGGLLVSGGNMANTVGFWAARAAAGERWSVRARGMAGGAPPMRVYASAETHTWVQKASDLAGMGTDSVRWIPTDGEQRMDLDALRRAIADDREGGDVPMMVVGTAGSVSTGAVDPLGDIAAICRDEDIWFHVDGAYGGFAAASPLAPEALRELARADSVAIDPHKWLYAPLEAGCLLVRDPGRLRAAFAYHPPYYHFGSEVTNFVDLGPQNSRGFRALKVWMQLRQAGRAGYAEMISDDIRLARRLDERVRETPELEGGPGGLSIATFRYVPPELAEGVGTADVEARLEALNREIQARMERGGSAFVSNAVVGERYLLRACIVNINTRPEDIDALPALAVELGREVWRSGTHTSNKER